MSEALAHLPIQDIVKNIDGKKEVFDKMVRRFPDDEDWFKGGLYHDNMDFGVPSFWFASWYDVSISPNLALFNHVRENAKTLMFEKINIWSLHQRSLCLYEGTENTVVGERSVGDARLNYDEQIYAWFDLWLKGIQTISRQRHQGCNIILWEAMSGRLRKHGPRQKRNYEPTT